MPASYLSPKTRVGASQIEGKGLFARRRIRQGGIVAIKGGHVYDARTLAKVKGRVAPRTSASAGRSCSSPCVTSWRERS